MTSTPIVDKVRKLLNLSKSSNVHEAAQAAAMAQELMLAHKIELADLEVNGGEAPAAPEEIIDETADEGNGVRRQRWRGRLAIAVAGSFGCKVYSYSGGRLQMVGPRGDVQTAKYLFGYLGLELRRLCDAAVDRRPVYDNATVWRNNFYDGAVAAIRDRLKDHRREQEEKFARTASQALVLVRRDEALDLRRTEERFKKILGPRGGRSVRLGGQRNANAYEHGQAAGRSVALQSSGRALPASKQRLGF